MILEFKGRYPKVNNAEIREESIICAGSLVTPNAPIPPRTLAPGSPAKPVRSIDEKDLQLIRNTLSDYQDLKKIYQSFSKLSQTYLLGRHIPDKPNCQAGFQKEYPEGYSHQDPLSQNRIYNRRSYISIFPLLSPFPTPSSKRGGGMLCNYFNISSS